MLSSKIYIIWIRKCSDFLLNNENTSIDLQIDHSGSPQLVPFEFYVFTKEEAN